MATAGWHLEHVIVEVKGGQAQEIFRRGNWQDCQSEKQILTKIQRIECLACYLSDPGLLKSNLQLMPLLVPPSYLTSQSLARQSCRGLGGGAHCFWKVPNVGSTFFSVT